MSLLDLFFPKRCLECQKPGKYLCSACVKRITRPVIIRDGYLTVFPYKGVIRKAIIALKYKYASSIAKELAILSSASLKKSKLKFSRNSILVPIPLHRQRERNRGFNQVAEVGELLAEQMGWKYVPDLLIRKLATSSQTGLNRDNRRQNVKGVFSSNPLYSSHSKSNPLVLFDDVLTTGSTINEAKQLLDRVGYRKIYLLTIAG